MSHDSHQFGAGDMTAPVFDDECGECGRKVLGRDRGISALDAFSFAAAWQRAADWNRGKVTNVTVTEAPLLDVLWSVQVQLERHGVPIGELPHD